MFKTLLKTHREKVENTKKMYEVSLQKLKGAESQVSLGYASTNYLFTRKLLDTLSFLHVHEHTIAFNAMVVFVLPVKSQKRGKHKNFVHAQ